jgi:hypothetical protein
VHRSAVDRGVHASAAIRKPLLVSRSNRKIFNKNNTYQMDRCDPNRTPLRSRIVGVAPERARQQGANRCLEKLPHRRLFFATSKINPIQGHRLVRPALVALPRRV